MCCVNQAYTNQASVCSSEDNFVLHPAMCFNKLCNHEFSQLWTECFSPQTQNSWRVVISLWSDFLLQLLRKRTRSRPGGKLCHTRQDRPSFALICKCLGFQLTCFKLSVIFYKPMVTLVCSCLATKYGTCPHCGRFEVGLPCAFVNTTLRWNDRANSQFCKNRFSVTPDETLLLCWLW